MKTLALYYYTALRRERKVAEYAILLKSTNKGGEGG